jgi:hypothetical protein
MPFWLAPLFVASTVGVFVAAAWSSRAVRPVVISRLALVPLGLVVAGIAFTSYFVSAPARLVVPHGGAIANALFPLLSLAVPIAICHLVCQHLRQRGARSGTALAVGAVAGLLAAAATPLVLIAATCGVSGECP